MQSKNIIHPTLIPDTKQAMSLILEKIHNLALLGKDPDLDVEDDEASQKHYIYNFFELDEGFYSVPPQIFTEIMSSLERKKIIEIDIMDEQDVAGAFKDYVLVCEFVADAVRNDPNVNVREILKHRFVFFRVINLAILEKEIGRFKLLKSKPIKKNYPEKILLGVELDEFKKCLIIITPDGSEEVSFKKKRIKKEDSRYASNPEKLQEMENTKSETKFFKSFAIFFDMRKTVNTFDNLKFSETTSISNLAQLLKIREKSAGNYIKRIRELIKDNDLPMLLKTDNKGNFKLFVKITKKVDKNK